MRLYLYADTLSCYTAGTALSDKSRRPRRARRCRIPVFRGNSPARGAGRARIWLALLAALLRPDLGVANDLWFQNITIEDGLSQNTISCILQDRDHFMWFGSEEGLNRYDGIRFQVFRHDRSNANSLSHDRVSCLLEDTDGSLWIGTLGGGLDRLDPARETFSHFHSAAGRPGTLSNDSVRALLPGGDGSLWVGTDDGLNRFDRRSGKFSRFLSAQGRPGLDGSCAVLCLHQDKAGMLWIGTRDGLHRYDPASGRCLALSGSRSKAPAAPSGRDQINCIFEDDTGSMWLATEAGLVRFDKRDGTFQFKVQEGRPLPHLYHSRIMDILRDDRGGVWVASESGIYFFPHPGMIAAYFKAGAFPRRLLKECFVVSLFQDPEDVLWAGTFSGIYKYDLRTRQFSLCGAERNGKEKEDFRFPVSSVCTDQRNRVWIGSYKNGLFGIDRNVNETKSFLSLPGEATSLKEQVVVSLYVDGKQTLWIGTNSGLHAYDTVREVFTGFYHSGREGGGLGSDEVTVVCEDRAGRLWTGSEDGLNLLDRERGTFTVLHNDLPGGPAIGRDKIYAILPDARGALWLGTYGAGLFRFDPERRKFIRGYFHRAGDPTSLGSDKVYCLLEDSRGRFWVGTNSGGLSLFDRNAGTFTTFTTEDGLPNNSVMGIVEDKQGLLWLSTGRGLCRFDPQRRAFRNFTARDGLQGNEFLPKSFCKSREGELFFGGPNGLTCFFPAAIQDNPHVPPVAITDIELFNRNRILSGDMRRLGTLKLGPRDRSVSFAFAALSYADPGRNQYAYKIEGLSDDWIYIGNRHEVTVSNLSPGSYVFRVKGSNNHGVWNEQGASLAIIMRPAWWQSAWFRLPALLLLLVFLFQWNHSRTRRLAARIKTEAAMDKFFEKEQISQREREIIMLVLKGKSNKEIEDLLFISMGTVKNHIYNIYQKIGVKNRAQLITLFKNLQVK
jgi:ligand-binding sensor domain-containing protein/DNA-binding CsgD family transcriptional regulator